MSYRAVQQALSRMHHKEVLVFAQDLARFQSGLEALAAVSFEEGERQMLEHRQELNSNFGGQRDAPAKPFAFANGLAVIPIHGSLLNRFGSSYSGATGYNFIRSQLRAALADDDVKGIVFDVNSPGGEAAGCFELADEIRASREVKPSLAMIDTLCASAAYALASAASKMVAVRSGTIGSIGVLVMHADVSSLLENVGVKISLIHSGKHKVDGNPFEALPDEVKADIQTNIDELRTDFVNVVATNRGLDTKAVFDTEARVYRGKKAMEMGLVDEVATVQQAVSSFMNALPGASTQMEQSQMTQQANQTAAPGADAAAEAAKADAVAIRQAEQARCSGILALPEASANGKLAQHLAFKTDMSVEAAKEALVAAGPAASTQAAANHFETAMNATAGQRPVVEPGKEASAQGEGMDATLAEFDNVLGISTGRKSKAAA